MSRWPRRDWIMVVMAGVDAAEPRPHMHCERCGERVVTEPPMRLATYIELLRGFSLAHKDCRPRPEVAA